MSKSRWVDGLALILIAAAATLAGVALRAWTGYPLDPSDERNWIAIAAQVASGADWPISGPLHFSATQALAEWAGMSHASALAALGVATTPAVLLAYAISYRLIGLPHAWPALLLLCTSTYFWAPLLESRPQQWGQALVMLCTTLAWHGLVRAAQPQRRLWLAWCLLFLIASWVHLLSSAVILMLCATLAFGVAVCRPNHLHRVLAWVLAALPGLVVMVLPDGPYRRTWFDVGHQQLQLDRPGLWVAALSAAATLWVLATLFRRFAPQLLARGLAQLQNHPRPWAAALMAGVLLLLVLQASLLPADAWVLYQGSVGQFALRQVGNLLFLAMFVLGLLHVACTPHLREAPAWQGLAALLAGAGLLAVAALAGSTLMVFTNWMLRVINYTLPMAAPFAAAGFLHWHMPAAGKLLLLAGAVSLSLLAAGHPQLLLRGL
jgi:hypothetical protein